MTNPWYEGERTRYPPASKTFPGQETQVVLTMLCAWWWMWEGEVGKEALRRGRAATSNLELVNLYEGENYGIVGRGNTQ